MGAAVRAGWEGGSAFRMREEEKERRSCERYGAGGMSTIWDERGFLGSYSWNVRTGGLLRSSRIFFCAGEARINHTTSELLQCSNVYCKRAPNCTSAW